MPISEIGGSVSLNKTQAIKMCIRDRLCGDRVSVFLDIQDGTIKDIAFQGAGCAISSASASLMTEALNGKKVDDVGPLFDAFHTVVTSDSECPHGLGKLSVLAGVRDYPSRVKCATLAWHCLLYTSRCV